MPKTSPTPLAISLKETIFKSDPKHNQTLSYLMSRSCTNLLGIALKPHLPSCKVFLLGLKKKIIISWTSPMILHSLSQSGLQNGPIRAPLTLCRLVPLNTFGKAIYSKAIYDRPGIRIPRAHASMLFVYGNIEIIRCLFLGEERETG